MTVSEANNQSEGFPTHDILRRILAQRAQRYTDRGPDLTPLGSARFRQEGTRLLIADAQLAPDSIREGVARIVSHARQRGMRIVWTVSHSMVETAETDALQAALLANGFVLDERLILMARQRELLAYANPAVTINPITSWPVMWAYEHGNRRSFYDDHIPDESIVTARARERWRQQEMGWYRYYAATLNDRFVGGLYISLWEDVPTLMGVYTLNDSRRQGVATAVLARAIHDLLESGRDTYCLYVKEGNPARHLYHELAFQTLSVEDTYVFDA